MAVVDLEPHAVFRVHHWLDSRLEDAPARQDDEHAVAYLMCTLKLLVGHADERYTDACDAQPCWRDAIRHSVEVVSSPYAKKGDEPSRIAFLRHRRERTLATALAFLPAPNPPSHEHVHCDDRRLTARRREHREFSVPG